MAAGDAIDAIARNLSSNVQLKTAKDEAVKGTQCNYKRHFPVFDFCCFFSLRKKLHRPQFHAAGHFMCSTVHYLCFADTIPQIIILQ